MDEKERFINTIKKSLSGLLPLHMAGGVAERVAKALIQDGAVFPPYKPGDVVYVIYEGYVTSAEVLAIYIDHDGGMFDLKIREKTETVNGFCTTINNDYTFDDVYRTKEEAQKALEQRKEDGKNG